MRSKFVPRVVPCKVCLYSVREHGWTSLPALTKRAITTLSTAGYAVGLKASQLQDGKREINYEVGLTNGARIVYATGGR